MSPLDLSGADTSGGDFEPIKGGTYPATVIEARWDETKNDGASLKAGTTMFVMAFRIADEHEEYGGRWLWRNFILPSEKDFHSSVPKDTAKKNKAMMEGMFVRALLATGVYDEADVMTKGFDPDPDAITGSPVTIRVSRKPDRQNEGQFRNNVEGVKPAGEAVASGSDLL